MIIVCCVGSSLSLFSTQLKTKYCKQRAMRSSFEASIHLQTHSMSTTPVVKIPINFLSPFMLTWSLSLRFHCIMRINRWKRHKLSLVKLPCFTFRNHSRRGILLIFKMLQLLGNFPVTLKILLNIQLISQLTFLVS